ncbi:MAG TPA: hypothetical protein VM935_19825 [Chitinophagaceae bacterium]|jgi:uncharacterized membrane protein (DUF485 family)|nr:hypothetical protein [Chitinophagaceae bacterium]
MSQESKENPGLPPKNVKSSDEVLQEIAAGLVGDNVQKTETTGAKKEVEILWQPEGQETHQKFNSRTAFASVERDVDEKRVLQLVKQQELRKVVAEADKMVQDNEGRRKFSWAIFIVMMVWMFMVLLVVIQCAKGKWALSDSVLIALITTTTATVIGIFIIVANYLFNRDKST